MPRTGDDSLAGIAEELERLTSAARGGSLDGAAALTALAAARRIAAELDHSELALIEAARDDGATWSRIAAAMGARNRQIAQKRHADLARRRCPPPVDAPTAQPRAQAREAGHDRGIPPAKALVSEGALPKSTRQPPGSAGASDPVPEESEYLSWLGGGRCVLAAGGGCCRCCHCCCQNSPGQPFASSHPGTLSPLSAWNWTDRGRWSR